jgi:hypothetical protein
MVEGLKMPMPVAFTPKPLQPAITSSTFSEYDVEKKDSSITTQTLTREKAATIISRYKGWPKSIYFVLSVGQRVQSLGDKTGWPKSMSVLSQLESAGYITLKRGTKDSDWMAWGAKKPYQVETADIELTTKGKELFHLDYGDRWKTEICQQALVAVTGISINADQVTALVEYTWAYRNFTPIFQTVFPISQISQENLRLHQERIWMRRYDDGWRVQR